MADNSCNILEKKAGIQETEEAIMGCQSETVLQKTDQETVQLVVSSTNQPLHENVESLTKFEKGSFQDQGIGGAKNMSSNDMLTKALKGDVGILKCGLKIDVIDDTAVIETGIGGEFEGGFVGFAHCSKKNEGKKKMKQETDGMNENSWRNLGKSSKNCSRITSGKENWVAHLVENQNMCGKNGGGCKKIYRRRFVSVEEQTKLNGSRKCLRTNGKGKALTQKVDGQFVWRKNYPKMDVEKIHTSASVKEQVKKKNVVHSVWRKYSRTNQNEKGFTHKVEDQNGFERKCPGADEGECVCEKRCDGSKRVYTRKEIEALRFVGIEEQRKMWDEIVSCSLTPYVMREYNGLVDSGSRKHIQVNFIPRRSILDIPHMGVSTYEVTDYAAHGTLGVGTPSDSSYKNTFCEFEDDGMPDYIQGYSKLAPILNWYHYVILQIIKFLAVVTFL